MAPLLWIVKTADSKSLSHSEKQEQLRVFSHAQRTSRRPKTTNKKRRPARTPTPTEQVGISSKQETVHLDDPFDFNDDEYALLELFSTPALTLEPHSDWPAAERRGLNYFLEVSVYKIITLRRDIDFWKGVVPCLAELHAGFRHLVVAIAATFELLFRPDSNSLNQFALEQCNKAIRSIISAKDLDTSWLLISCILVSAYNLLRSDLEAADTSIESGLKMVGSAKAFDSTVQQLSRILTSLGKQHGFKLWAPDITFQFDKTMAGREPLIIDPTFAKGPYTGVGQVLAAFKTVIVEFVAKLMRNLSLGAHIDPNSLLAQDVLQHFSEIFFHWEAYYRSLSDEEADKKLQLVQLKVGLQSAYVLFAAKVLGSIEAEVDAHTNRYSNMLQLGQEVIAARHAGRPVIYLDRVVNGALYTAAMLCRGSLIRRKLIALLKSQVIYEDGLVNYLRGRVAEIIAEFEDQNDVVNFCCDLPEERLIRLCGLYCEEDRVICVQYMGAAELDRLNMKEHRSSLGEALESFTVQEIDDCLKGMAATYKMYMKADSHLAPDGYLRMMYYRSRPVSTLLLLVSVVSVKHLFI